jgi:putative hydrolase of the HAD superfamily
MDHRILLLDLGGVLADLGDPVAAMGLDVPADEFWGTWVNAPAVRAFETGQVQEQEFFEAVAAQVGLASDSAEQRFHAWQLRPFDGLEEFIEGAAARFEIALLSNTNPIHWAQITAATPVFSTFAALFLSYETGRFKPETAAFEQVIEHFGVAPASIVFYDDSARNVEAARQLGIDAHCVSGLDAVRRHMDCE